MRVMRKAIANRAEASSDCIMSRSDIQPKNATMLVNTISPAIDLSRLLPNLRRLRCKNMSKPPMPIKEATSPSQAGM